VKKSKLALILYYGLGASLGVSLLGYGLGWKRFALTPNNYVYYQLKGAEGRIASVSGSGFGKYRDYVVRVEGSSLEFLFSGSIAQPRYAPDGGPSLDLSSVLATGKAVKLRASGGSRPVVLELLEKTPEGGYAETLSYNVGSRRYVRVLEHAAERGDDALRTGKLVLVATVAGHLLYALARATRRRLGRVPPARAA
jgi:hypothetical protein